MEKGNLLSLIKSNISGKNNIIIETYFDEIIPKHLKKSLIGIFVRNNINADIIEKYNYEAFRVAYFRYKKNQPTKGKKVEEKIELPPLPKSQPTTAKIQSPDEIEAERGKKLKAAMDKYNVKDFNPNEKKLYND